jgi:Tol biopolymer transport system component
VNNGLIVYTAGDSERIQQIFTVSPNATGARQLTSSAGQTQYPAWSSDGRRIAFTSSRTGNPELWVMHADGTHQRRLTSPPIMGGFVPSWSPDDRHIVFSAMAGNPARPEIWTVDAGDRRPPAIASQLIRAVISKRRFAML